MTFLNCSTTIGMKAVSANQAEVKIMTRFEFSSKDQWQSYSGGVMGTWSVQQKDVPVLFNTGKSELELMDGLNGEVNIFWKIVY